MIAELDIDGWTEELRRVLFPTPSERIANFAEKMWLRLRAQQRRDERKQRAPDWRTATIAARWDDK